MARLLLLNGPNLGQLGRREPGIYGTTTLADIESLLRTRAVAAGHELDAFQSDSEAELIQRVHAARDEGIAVILFNPAAFTHTSVALRDALLSAQVPFIELHLSNVAAREAFRHHSFISPVAAGIVVGFGVQGYVIALEGLVRAHGSPAPIRT
jgi:3-dehydroquinate dehydratase-2